MWLAKPGETVRMHRRSIGADAYPGQTEGVFQVWFGGCKLNDRHSPVLGKQQIAHGIDWILAGCPGKLAQALALVSLVLQLLDGRNYHPVPSTCFGHFVFPIWKAARDVAADLAPDIRILDTFEHLLVAALKKPGR